MKPANRTRAVNEKTKTKKASAKSGKNKTISIKPLKPGGEKNQTAKRPRDKRVFKPKEMTPPLIRDPI